MQKGQKTVGQALPIGRGPTLRRHHPFPPGRTPLETEPGIATRIVGSVASPRTGPDFGGNRPPVDQRGLAAAGQLRVCLRSEALQRAVLPVFGAGRPQHDPSAQLPGLGWMMVMDRATNTIRKKINLIQLRTHHHHFKERYATIPRRRKNHPKISSITGTGELSKSSKEKESDKNPLTQKCS